MGRIGRGELDVRRIVGNGKVVAKILSGFGVLLLWEAADALDEADVSETRKRYLLKQIALKSLVEKGM